MRSNDIKSTEAESKKPQKTFNKRKDFQSIFNDICDILNPKDMEIIVTRSKRCETLYANKDAEARMVANSGETVDCKQGFARSFPNLCDHCPYGGRISEAQEEPFEILDASGRLFKARIEEISWIDNKPAAVFMMQDITAEKEQKERLYNLAYIDQLTAVPNRQKLKDDFLAFEEQIAKGEIRGALALFDLDNFKAVNDTYGHNTGDVVLRRLTEYFQSESSFSDHLYRLGGDEFVLLFADSKEYESDEDMVKSYSKILSPSLRSYTLPSIELKCTLSMGVALFPQHGVRFSELLRKADIALYKAKSEGRNSIIFFKDQYDSAQKCKDMYINIQPILLTAGKTYGYELVDRGNNDDEDDKIISLNDFNRTLDALGLHEITSEHSYFISYSKQFLNTAVLRDLPRDKFIVQVNIPSKVTTENLREFYYIMTELKKHKYMLAINGLSSSSSAAELLRLADFCKFSRRDSSAIKEKAVINAFPKVRFIATHVDNLSDFQAAKETGFHMFQGYYFNQPVVKQKAKEISPLKVNYFRLLKLSSTTDYMDFREISSIISADVALSYKLLRILNSAAVGLRNVSSIASAVAYMGEESLKKWIAVLALRGIAEDKPLELVRMSLIRARFGELLAPHFYISRNPQNVFMVGMLSLLHIALDISREELLEDLPVTDEIRSSLISKTGIYSDLLKFYENYEYSNWDAVSQFVEENQLDSTMVCDAYIEAAKWYSELAKA